MRINLIIGFLLFVGLTLGQNPCPTPDKPGLEEGFVHDYSGFITNQEEDYLETKLKTFEDSTSNQIAVVILDTLCGTDPGMMAYLIGKTWGVGQGELDNGVVVLIKPKPANGRGKGQVFIATGKGLEGAIPDAIANRITDQLMVPWFKKGENFKAIDRGVDVIMDAAREEYSDPFFEEAEFPKGPIAALFGFFGLFGILFYWRVRRYAMLNGISFWKALRLILFSGSNSKYDDFNGGTGPFGGKRPRRTYWPRSGGFGSGTFGGGGSFGGGSSWGGFGGGSFGGGGAGGSW